MAEQVVLLGFWASPFAMRVAIGLREKGVEFESREEHLLNGKSTLLLHTNHVHKKIPVLIHKGKPVSESLVILQYIDEVWKHKSPLLPSDPYDRAHALFWANFVDQKIYPNVRLVWGSSGEVHEAAKKELLRSFQLLESELGDKTYFGGETFGFVDISLIPFYSRFYALEKYGNLRMEEELPRLVAWAKRCQALRDSVAKTLPDQREVYDYVTEVIKALGTSKRD